MNKLLQLLAKNRGVAKPRAMEISGPDTTLYLYDAIVSDDISAEWMGGVSAQSMAPQIRAVTGGTLHLRINSPGGDVFAAQAIIAAIKQTNAHVVAHIDGLAASAATLIATAADSVEMSDGAMYMIHCANTIAYGNAADMAQCAALLDKTDGIIAEQYAAKTGKPAMDMKALMDAETWFTAQEAVDLGLVDSISATPKVKNEWDLSIYAKAPSQSPQAAKKDKKPLKPMNNAEADFLTSMIEHHGMAITMASDLVKADPQDPLRDFAEGIISAQSGEIGLMRLWLEVGVEGDAPTNTYASKDHRERQQQRLRLVARTSNQ